MKPVASPCKKVCAVDGRTSLCLGCGRTLKEIGAWTSLTDEQRDTVMSQLDARMETLRALGKLGPVT